MHLRPGPFTAFALLLAGCGANPTPPVTTEPARPPAPPARPEAAATRVNPLLSRSPLPFQMPPFDRITDADFEPAFEAGMTEQLDEVRKLAGDPAAPSFENTVVALEKTGRTLARVANVFFNLTASNTNPTLDDIDLKMAPRLSAHSDAIYLDPALFARVDAVYSKRGELKLDPESMQLLERYHSHFVRAGAKLPSDQKERLKVINQALSTLATRFRQTVLKATKDSAVVVDSEAELAGLSPEQIGAAKEAAKERKLDGKWVITLQNTTIQPPLEQLDNRELRKRIFEASSARGRGGDADTTSIIEETIKLRSEKAKLLGYDTYAAYVLAEETAKTPAAVAKILRQLAPAALAKARIEAAAIQSEIASVARAEQKQSFKLEPWDWAYYAARVQKARFNVDPAEVKKYFELERVLKDGVFYAAHQLYGLSFTERRDLPVYHPDVRVFDVHDADDQIIGLFVMDYFKRDNKGGGAWMSTFVDQSGLLDEKPIVINNLNIPKPPEGQPTLLTFDEVTTAFHEFGHALHGLLSSCKYPLLSGTNVPRDFVEFPSQFNEMWVREPAVLANFAKDRETGAAMPKALLDKVLAADDFGRGYSTLEYLEAALLDQAWHQIPDGKIPRAAGVVDFERAALAKEGVTYAPVPPRYHSTYFSHIFTGGYASGYYAYIWSEVLARDAGAWFHAHGGLSRQAGEEFRAKILSRGRTEEPDVLFQKFYGRAPDIGPLLEYRGLGPVKR